MTAEIFNDSSMLEIFRAEVETHADTLTAGLLALERNPADVTHVEKMMRAAHSIKGAARIVGIDPAVRVAHVMEDGFVAAQNGKLTLHPGQVDVLLRGVDLFNRVANASKGEHLDWSLFDADVNPLVAELTAVLSNAPASVAPRALPTTPESAPVAIRREATVSLSGLFDARAAEVARKEFLVAVDAQASRIQIDLAAMTDLDAIGLALLVAIPDFVGPGGPRIELVNVTADVRPVLEATGVLRLYPAGRD